MSKIAVFAVISIFLLSCTLSYPNDTVLTNHSSRTVTVNLYGANRITLSPSESVSIETRRDMNPRERIQSFSPDRRVRFVYTNPALTLEFFDRNRYEVRILNLSGQAGTLSADGWMDSTSFGAQNTEQAMGRFVYTRQPVFAARAGGFYLPVLYSKEANVFFVTIGN